MKKLLAGAITVAAIGSIVAACGSGDGGGDIVEVTKGTVIQNVTVVNTRDGSLAPGRSVVLEGGKIKAIAAAASVRLGGTAQAIDAAGKYMVPGYLDMHAHTVAFADSQPTYWPLLIANGVTGIREM